MWGPVLGLALMGSLNPVRLSVILLIVSRARPVQNLLAFWLGAMALGIPAVLIPLVLLHDAEVFESTVRAAASSATVRHIQLGIGLFALAVAALMIVRMWVQRRANRTSARARGGRHRLPANHRRYAGSSGAATMVDEAETPTAISAIVAQGATDADAGSAFGRLRRRAHNAWENGSRWVAFVLGIMMAPAPDAILFAVVIIVSSGAAIGAQLSAGIALVVVMLAAVELILLSHLVAPEKAEAVLRRVHDWAQARRRQVVVAMFIIVGVSLVATAMSAM